MAAQMAASRRANKPRTPSIKISPAIPECFISVSTESFATGVNFRLRYLSGYQNLIWNALQLRKIFAKAQILTALPNLDKRRPAARGLRATLLTWLQSTAAGPLRPAATRT
jgi:hypothetical protein